jgi:hypothetical protein
MCDCGNTDAGRYFAKVGGQFGDLATNKAMRLVDMGKAKFKNWTGFGDYKIVGNSLIQGSPNGQIGIVTQGRSTIVRWREYIGDVYTHPSTVGAFNATTFTVNPGNLQTFPWLSTLATQYEQYKPRGVIFEFKSTATDTTTNASLGSVLMATDYDLVDANYKNKAEMMNSAYSSEAKMTDGMYHGIECDPEELDRKVFFCRNTSPSTFTSADRDYDVCKTTIATQGGGLAAGQSVGSLYVHYEFEFLKEQVFGGITAQNNLVCYMRNTVAPAAPVLEDFKMTVVNGYNFGLTFAAGGIVFPQKWAGATFKLTFQYTQAGGYTVTAPTGLVFQGCAPTNVNTGAVVGGGWWAAYYSPYAGTTQPAVNSSSAEAYVVMNQPLLIPATMNWPATSSWGIMPATLGTFPILVIEVELINQNFNT